MSDKLAEIRDNLTSGEMLDFTVVQRGKGYHVFWRVSEREGGEPVWVNGGYVTRFHDAATAHERVADLLREYGRSA